jgi:hypothetical protein
VLRKLDLILNLVFWGLPVVWLSLVAIARWIRRGRIEPYSWGELLPKWAQRWLLGESDKPPATAPITLWGWLALATVAVWLLLPRK